MRRRAEGGDDAPGGVALDDDPVVADQRAIAVDQADGGVGFDDGVPVGVVVAVDDDGVVLDHGTGAVDPQRGAGVDLDDAVADQVPAPCSTAAV